MSLRTRIALGAAAAVAVAVAVSSVVAFSSARRELIEEIDESLVERAGAVARFPLAAFRVQRGPGRGRAPADPFGRPGVGFDALYFQVIGDEGERVIPLGQEVVLPVADGDMHVLDTGVGSTVRTVDIDGSRLRMITVPLGDGALQVARSLEEADQTLRELALAQWATGIAGILAAAGLGLVVARSALRPVTALTEAAEHVAETQELASRIEVDRKDEVGRLASSFNAMLAALGEARAQQHRLVRDASHELRTPLTAVRTNIELLAHNEDIPDQDRTSILGDLTTEVEELSALVDELVQLATDRGSDEPFTSGLRLDEVVEDVVARFRRRTGREITLDVADSRIDGRRGQIERAVGNLIDNADKWSPDGAAIEVTVGQGSVYVADAGPGIGPEHRDRIFERFFRAPEAGDTPGSGLGLAIVQQIVHDHGGEVFAGESPRGGARVGFRIPPVTFSADS
ncbi:MAG: ATP-binding protein [Acidimicrobiia bacterium]